RPGRAVAAGRRGDAGGHALGVTQRASARQPARPCATRSGRCAARTPSAGRRPRAVCRCGGAPAKRDIQGGGFMVHGQCAVPTHDTPGRWRLWSTAVRMSSTVRTAAAPPAALLLTGLLLTGLLLAAAWPPAGAAADVINPELAAKLATLGPDELVRVIIYMEEQPLVTAAMGPDTVKFLLKDAAARSQR